MGSVAVRNWLAGAIGLGVLITAVITNNSIADHPDLALRVVIDTSVAIIGSLVAVLVYGRYRRSKPAQNPPPTAPTTGKVGKCRGEYRR